jgi:zinc-RING finger domain
MIGSIADINPLEWTDVVADLSTIFGDMSLEEANVVDISHVFDDDMDEPFAKLVESVEPNQQEEAESCPICFECINPNKNFTVTNCNHRFCSQCIFKHASQNNSCPFCRTELYEEEIHEVSDDEDDDEITLGSEDDEEEYDEDDDEDEEEDNEGLSNIDSIMVALQAKFSYKDLSVLLLQRYSSEDAKYTQEKVDDMGDEFWDTVYEVDGSEVREKCERHLMEAEDVRAVRSDEDQHATEPPQKA